jgi:MOSC domain-containing protein YiiM
MQNVYEGMHAVERYSMKVLSVNVGVARALEIEGRSVLTSIGKRQATGPVAVRLLGLEGDEQADLSVHGGPSKAVYAYPAEHHAFWQTVRAQAKIAGWAEPPAPGLFGENLTLQGLLENKAWIGDLLRFPNCALAVSEPRFPCFKFNGAMGFKHASKLMTQSGFCGFYLGVREPGTIAAGDVFELVPGPRDVCISELFRARSGGRAAR